MDYKSVSSLTTEKAAQLNELILTIPEVASMMKVSEKTIYRLCRDNQIPHIKIRGQYRFTKSAIEKWLKGELDD